MEPDQIYALFGRRVAEARAKAELTQMGLAEKVGLSRASIANIEAGRQRIVLHQAIEIAEAVGARSVTELLPVDLLRPGTNNPKGLELTLSGSHVSKSEAAKIAQIVASS